MKANNAAVRFAFALIAAFVLSTFHLQASEIFAVSIDTAPLVGDTAGPFSLDLQFTDGSGLGDANNTVTAADFKFGVGEPTGSANLTGGASGSLSSQIVLTDSTFFSEAFQTFTPGSTLTFLLDFTTNVDSPTPDEFSIGILDNTLSEIPTLGPGDSFLVLDLNSSHPVPQTFASDTTQVPLGGGGPINISAPVVTQVSAPVPEPGTMALTGAVLLFLSSQLRRGAKKHGPHRQTHAVRSVLAVLAFLCAVKGQAQSISASLLPGGGLDAVAVNPATNRIYAGNQLSGLLSVVDGATYQTLATVNVGGNAGGENDVGKLVVNLVIAVNPVTNKVYVANVNVQMVTVIDGVTNAATIVPIGAPPSALAVNTVTNKIYVATESGVTIIDGATNATSAIAIGQPVFDLALNPQTNKVYVVGRKPNGTSANGQMVIIDGATNATQTLVLPALPFAVAVNQVTNQIYTANIVANTVSVIDGGTFAVTSISAGQMPAALAVNSVTNKIYAANSADGTVTIINGPTNSTTLVTVGDTPAGFAVNAATNQIYVANVHGTNISIIDGAADAVTGSITSPAMSLSIDPVGNRLFSAVDAELQVIDLNALPTHSIPITFGAISIAIQPVTNKIYVGSGTNLVRVYDGATEALLTSIQVATGINTGPVIVALNPVTNVIYAVNENANTVAVIDGITDTVQTTIGVGVNPVAIAVDPQRDMIYVANQSSSTVTIINGATNSAVSVPVIPSPASIALNIATDTAYLAGHSGNVTVLDGATLTTSTVAVRDSLTQIFADPLTNKVFAVGFAVTAIDGTTLEATQLPLSGGIVVAATFNPVTDRLFEVNSSGQLTSIDAATNTETLGTVASNDGPVVLGVDPVTNKVFSLDFGDVTGGGVTEYDPGSLTPRLISAGGGAVASIVGPSSIAVNPLTHRVYMGGLTLTVIDEVQANPGLLVTTIAPIPGNLTNSSTPTLTFSAVSQFQVPATDAYYQLDTWEGSWTPATPVGDGVFTGISPSLMSGAHIIYAYATDGEEATSVDGGGALSIPAYGPVIGNIAAYGFNAVPSPAIDVTGQVTVTRGGFLLNRGTGNFVQVVTVTNSGSNAIAGPVSLVLDSLSANASVSGASGVTTQVAPLGSPYVNLNLGPSAALNPGESVAVTLQFTDPTKTGITYTTRVLAGTGSR